MKLSDINVKRAKPGDTAYKIFDGGGLYLQVEPTGGKLWRYKYRFDGKEKKVHFGKYPDVSLLEARRRHREAREQLAQGIDPAVSKKALKSAKGELAANSFELVGREWFQMWKQDKSEKHSLRNITNLEKDVFPYIGKRPIAEIKAPDILEVCRRVEKRGAIETAHRVKVVISQVMRYGIVTGRAERDPCPDLRGALLPVHHQPLPSLTEPDKVAELLRSIDEYKGTNIVRAALALAPLVFVRPGELRNAKWADINLGKAEWVFYYSKQRESNKSKRKLIVPLSRQSVAILKDIHPLTGDGVYVFPGLRPGRCLSDGTINKALRQMGYDTRTEITGHGFRAMARTVIAERLRLDTQWIERQLSHRTSERLGESYDRTQFLDDRRKMMQTWADYLDGLKTGKEPEADDSVVPSKKKTKKKE
ncbi:MAG: integrase arm-type DNA-binding domain-containing protein [Holophagaceae bacterium]|nr:integrase arm-type DNA-binding domain-containing protein [Holophagaceae bacterium]